MFVPQAAEHNNKLVSVIGNDKKKRKKRNTCENLKRSFTLNQNRIDCMNISRLFADLSSYFPINVCFPCNF